MNKTQLIAHIAQDADISQAAARRVVDAITSIVTRTLRKRWCPVVQIVGFGTFATAKRDGRTGRNPRTGETIKVKAKRVPVFRPGVQLKKAVQA